MTPEQEAHLKLIKSNFSTKVDKKYREGQKEHGGDLWDKTVLDLIDECISEVIDAIVYLETMRERLVGK